MKENFRVKRLLFFRMISKQHMRKILFHSGVTPFGNSLTLDFAKTLLDAYQLGQGPATDFLTINCASTDYVGHLFGPNSIEIEDVYLRLDLDLAAFFSVLDAKIGKGQLPDFSYCRSWRCPCCGLFKEKPDTGRLFFVSRHIGQT